ncbi:cysteine-rich CWC family protein [Thalassolituus hydrocarboniclasticus]|uniref:Cysteine-rich CWC family protein n=1 Tax=Thalassolituus hydrocarboniclasticus TaxID=2742796 RepID=A0ABY6AAR3_9GAMM|nr:cysteine-rich CWC family protein [Thalassolituus hydrocarboniclasticus]
MSSSVDNHASVPNAEKSSGAGDEQCCPLCGGQNQCAVAAGTEPSACWCFSSGVSIRELLRQRPDLEEHYSRQTSCICSACVSRLMSEQACIP